MRISRKKKPAKAVLPRYNVNDKIMAPKVRLLDVEGNNIGVVTIAEARKTAMAAELDLVEINPKSDPPVAQIIDYGGFKYQKEKEIRKQKINSHVSELKGLRLSVRIGDHDLEVRKNQALDFLNRGDKVKAEIILKGRENGRPNLAFDVIKRFIEMIRANIPLRVEQETTKQGNKVTAIVTKCWQPKTFLLNSLLYFYG